MNIVEEINKELSSARKILQEYNAIPTGQFGAMFVRRSIDKAEKALKSRDQTEMLEALEELRGIN